MLGNGRLEAKCQDGETRLGQIRGQMRKKVSRPLGRYILQPSGCLLVPAGRLWIYCSRGVLARREIGGMGREGVKGNLSSGPGLGTYYLGLSLWTYRSSPFMDLSVRLGLLDLPVQSARSRLGPPALDAR